MHAFKSSSLAAMSLLLFLPLIPAMAQSPAKVVLNPPNLSITTQYGYSQIAMVSASARTIYISGQVGFDKDGPNDFETQVDRAFGNLTSALAAAGATPSDVVKITLLIKDHSPARLAYLGKKRREVFDASPPASTLIPVPLLYTDGVSFEVDAVAVSSKPMPAAVPKR